MNHPEFFWNLKCSYCLFKSGSAEGSRPLSGIGVSPKYFFSLLRRQRRRKKREKWGTAPYPRQGAHPLATPAKRCLKGFSKIRDDSWHLLACDLNEKRISEVPHALSRERFLMLKRRYSEGTLLCSSASVKS